MRSIAVVTTIGLLAIAAGCGSNSDQGSAGGNGGTTTTVAVKAVNGVGDVLVDSHGAALYAADQEMNGKVRCDGQCAATWIPLTLASGRQPTASTQVPGKLGVAKRPDGARQVSLDGKPLYRFADDPKPGEVTGNGLSDDFGGMRFTWQVVTTGGASSQMAQPSSSSPY